MQLYNIIINIINLFVSIYKHFDKKLLLRESKWQKLLGNIKPKTENEIRYWFHSASMGEFEQAKPIIESLKAKNHNVKIICSFFSPSGYENQKKYKYADYMLYFPIDTKKNIHAFIDRIQPDKVVFVRYEIWPNCLSYLKTLTIPVYLICASVPTVLKNHHQHFLRQFYLNSYKMFNQIYSISHEEFITFNELGVKINIKSSNDTRFDRIIQKVKEFKANPYFDNDLLAEKNVIVAGSSWEPDEDILINAYNKLKDDNCNLLLVLVPHEPTEKHIKRMLSLQNEFVLLSEIDNIKIDIKDVLKDKKIIIVDSIGKLLKLYANADIAYIGGAFGVGVHSVTEPAGYGVPLICGKGFANSPDAVNLNKLGALSAVANEHELYSELKLIIENNNKKTLMGNTALNYIMQGQGASEIVLKEIFNI